MKNTQLDDAEAEKELRGPVRGREEMLDVINSGGAAGGKEDRVRALDRIDGTKGFLRGGQYAIALALIEGGDVKVGVLGCPNLPVDDAAPLSAEVWGQNDGIEPVVLFSAVQNQGATSRPLGAGALKEGKNIDMREIRDISDAVFCESVEVGRSNHSEQKAIAKRARHHTQPSLRMDSRAKYGSCGMRVRGFVSEVACEEGL